MMYGAPMIHQRLMMQRDPPYDINVPRGTLANWEVRGSRPNIDDGDAGGCAAGYGKYA